MGTEKSRGLVKKRPFSAKARQESTRAAALFSFSLLWNFRAPSTPLHLIYYKRKKISSKKIIQFFMFKYKKRTNSRIICLAFLPSYYLQMNFLRSHAIRKVLYKISLFLLRIIFIIELLDNCWTFTGRWENSFTLQQITFNIRFTHIYLALCTLKIKVLRELKFDI